MQSASDAFAEFNRFIGLNAYREFEQKYGVRH